MARADGAAQGRTPTLFNPLRHGQALRIMAIKLNKTLDIFAWHRAFAASWKLIQLPSAKLADIHRLGDVGVQGFHCVSQATMLQPQAIINSASEFQHKVLVRV